MHVQFICAVFITKGTGIVFPIYMTAIRIFILENWTFKMSGDGDFTIYLIFTANIHFKSDF